MERLEDQHAAWLARTFGRTDYLPLTRDDATALSQAGTIVDKYKGTHLFREGEPSTATYVIQEGEVELYRMTAGGRSVFGRVGTGAVVGDIAMFQEQPYLSSARAVTSVRALRLDRDPLVSLLLSRPVIAMRWLVNGLGQLEATQRSLIRLMNRTVLEQVADLLQDEQDRFGEVKLSQATIAELLGASRQSVNEALGKLKEAGAIDTGYRRITVRSTDALIGAANS
ncbi:MAG: cyclic nucleotide-binding domain-containing protein [Proteobacteria bacterium]|nr:cyclic nucleotide-binding domain-containing protein [Pseudomonadota bacterium]